MSPSAYYYVIVLILESNCSFLQATLELSSLPVSYVLGILIGLSKSVYTHLKNVHLSIHSAKISISVYTQHNQSVI